VFRPRSLSASPSIAISPVVPATDPAPSEEESSVEEEPQPETDDSHLVVLHDVLEEELVAELPSRPVRNPKPVDRFVPASTSPARPVELRWLLRNIPRRLLLRKQWPTLLSVELWLRS